MSTLAPAGPASASIATVWWWMLIAGVAIWMGMLVLASWTFRRKSQRLGWRGARRLIVGGGIVLPTAAIVALLAYGLPAGQAMRLPGETAFVVDVRGHQWWWEVAYPEIADAPVYGAGEIHIPAGQPVTFRVQAADVIHSFWAPRLGGKVDAIPGRVNLLHLRADRPGRYEGACAEFCGTQHARMRMAIVAHPAEDWPDVLRQLGAPHPRAQRLRDHAGFRTDCLRCHSVQADRQVGDAVLGDAGDGWPAAGNPLMHSVSPAASDGERPGPSLAAFAGRATLGAGLLPNTPEHLARWLREHRVYKPGNHMPVSTLPPEDLDEIARLLGERP